MPGSCRYTFLTFNGLFIRIPLILECLVQTCTVDVLGPPLSPAGQEDLLWIFGEVVPRESIQETLSTYIRC